MKNYSKDIATLQIFMWVVCLWLSICSTAQANEYYVSIANGNDTYPGTSAQPFQTIQKCADVAQAGDTCNIGSGTYREMVTLKNSGTSDAPVTFTGMPGQTATISGADLITGWTQYSGNIYVANTGSNATPTQLYVDGQFYDIAHYPNSGYLTATSNSSDTDLIIDANLTLSSSQIIGATVMTRVNPWDISSNVATAYADGTITLSGNFYYSSRMQAKYGFYLTNKLWMLTVPGEWVYDPSADKLYLWTANSDNPSNHTVEVPTRSSGITDKGKNYITIQNLSIADAGKQDINISKANNVTLNALAVSGGQFGIRIKNMSNSTVQNNSVQNTLSSGMYFDEISDVNILNNTINNAGNAGSSPKNSVGGLVIKGSGSTNVTISGNNITNSGYAGIWYMGNNITVENNTIDKSCLVLDDCAGIYTYTNGNVGWTSTISGNTVTNSIGNFSGTAYTFTQAQGIYLDDLSNGYTVTNNKISNADYGIYVHTGYNNTITGNKVYDARAYGLQISESGGKAGEVEGAVHNNIVTGNTFETIATPSLNSNLGGGTINFYSSFGAPVAGFGTFNNNQYCHPNISYVVGTDVNPGWVMTNYTLSDWQKASGQDLNSTDTNSSCKP